MTRGKRGSEKKHEPYYKRANTDVEQKRDVYERGTAMSEDRRHEPCQTVTTLKGQVNLLKWIFGVTFAVVVFVGGGLWSRTDSLKDEMIKNSKELTFIINELDKKLITSIAYGEVIKVKLENIEIGIDESKRLTSFNQNLIKEIQNERRTNK